MNIFETERLIVRSFNLSDASFVLKLLNDPTFIENIVDRGVRTIQGAKTYLIDGPLSSYESFGFGLWCVERKKDRALLGMAGLIQRDYLDSIDLGYALLPEYSGYGYAYEACEGILDYARSQLKMNRVLAIVNETNHPSKRVLSKLKFRFNHMMELPVDGNTVALFERDL